MVLSADVIDVEREEDYGDILARRKSKYMAPRMSNAETTERRALGGPSAGADGQSRDEGLTELKIVMLEAALL